MPIYESEFKGAQIDARLAAVATMQTAISNLETALAAKYSKPSSGIPETDLDAAVQSALAKARSAVQDLSNYYTKDEVDALLAAINSQEYVDVAVLPTASASTMGKMYLVGPDASGYYSYYFTSYDGSTYSWVGPLGTTQISLANYAPKAQVDQLEQEIGDMSELATAEYVPVAVPAVEGYYYSFQNLAPTQSSDYEYAILSVSPGEKYLIDGWNLNSNNPLAFVMKAGTTTKARAIYESTSKHLSGEYVIPEGYDTLIVNGRTANYPVSVQKWTVSQPTVVDVLKDAATLDAIAKSLPLHVAVVENSNYVAGSDSVKGVSIFVGQRFNDSYDTVWSIGNKNSTINRFFDLISIYTVPRDPEGVTPKHQLVDLTYLLGHTTDYILPIRLKAVNNIDGDFTGDENYFTGGFHGYGNNTAGDYSQTMKEMSKKILLDGKELAVGDSLYGRRLEVIVVNQVQASNTEKENGTGREVIEQTIRCVLEGDNKMIVDVEWKALEAVDINTLHCFGQYFDFPSVRFVGSSSMRGIYTPGTNVFPTDEYTNAIRNYGSDYAFEVGIDNGYGLGDGQAREGERSAFMTTATKGYFNVLKDDGITAISLSAGDMVCYRGYFKLQEND